MSNPVLEAIAQRRSNRGYEARPLSTAQIDALLKAAVESPSANNAQPWHFTVVRDAALLAEINAEASQRLGRNLADIFFGAPVVIFISADPSSRWGRLDSGVAVENIALAAQGLGLGSVILGLPDAAFTGPKGPDFARRLKFPEGHRFAVAIAVGYPTVTKEAHPVAEGRIDFVE
ncbi:MAG: nitroreductase family protein [Oscillospiraceae bacterium]|jgi:nitroreductase|nr:nitroreductase family protein [Oscillospiraceae bacterium]